jgi:hypothetical protein
MQKVEATKRTVISKSTKRRAVPKGSQQFHQTEMVVYKTKLSDGKYHSETRHEIVK